jgi:Streptomyces sporulation and cell division protein, SsgA
MAESSGTMVSADLDLHLVVPEHIAVPLVASLSYSGDDPYAVSMAFHVGTDDPVEWIFARGLLAEGMERPAGEGDVHAWPSPGNDGDTLNIALSSPFGEALFEAPAVAVAAFLRRTYEAVPPGYEGDFVDIEGEIEDLLSTP